MVLANKITFARFLLIPVVVASILLYARGVNAGTPEEGFRWLAIISFGIAAISDFADGYVARKFKQQTWSGELIDPLADKALLVSTILALTFTPWPWQFPLWFLLVIVLRDFLAIAGALLVFQITGKVDMQVHWSGKAATFFQICAVCWVMLNLQVIHPIYPTVIASLLTILSGLIYLFSAVKQIRSGKAQ